MRNAKKLSQEEILRRARKLYFDVMPDLQFIFADEYGRFSYRDQSLIEQNRHPETIVFKINRSGFVKEDVEDVDKEEQLEELKATYKELTDKDAPKNWGIPKLTKEIDLLKEE